MEVSLLPKLIAVAVITLSGDGIAPESISSTANGTVYIGSATRWVYRALPGGATATPWAQAPGDGPRSVFGVFADERAQVLWACAGSVPATTSELYAFELQTGALQARYPLPTAGGICNDIAVADDGAVYVTDSIHMQVLRLRKGAGRLEIWAGNAPGSFGAQNGIVDGIAILESRVFVNTLITRKLFAVPIGKDGAAGRVAEVTLDRSLEGPDGMRRLDDDRLLVVETAGDGALALVTIEGRAGSVRTIRKGFDRGAVAVAVTGGVAYVLGNRPPFEVVLVDARRRPTAKGSAGR